MDAAALDPQAVAAWLMSRSTGASAKSIVAVAQGTACNGDYPSDAGDFGRCERAMEAIPGLRDHLPRMATVNAYWAALVPAWDSIAAASDRTAAIRAIIQPIEDMDPEHVRINSGMSMRVGGKISLTTEQVAEIKAADRKRRGAPPVKNTPEDTAVEDQAYGVAADELRQFIEQFEQLEAEKKDVAERQKEVMAEAKARGYDTKVMKKIVALRKRHRDDVAEEEAILEMYKSALGMA